MNIEVYTDGSATTKDKPGGWGFVVVVNGIKYAECGGHMAGASNNDAEMEAAIQGLAAVLKYVNEKRQLLCAAGSEQEQIDRLTQYGVTLVSDSQLILGWASGTFQFKQANKIEKYKQLQFLVHRLGVKTRWIKGHTGDEHNERCDKLANEARLGVNRKKDREEAIASGKTLIGTKKSGTICIWYKDKLKVIDLETNVCEDYERPIHGPRGGIFEVREEKSR
jgi:ribonuclease HI